MVSGSGTPRNPETKTKRCTRKFRRGTYAEGIAASGQARSFGDVGSMFGSPESGHGSPILKYTPRRSTRLPMRTAIAIAGLARDGALIEIEAVAALPPAARSKAVPLGPCS